MPAYERITMSLREVDRLKVIQAVTEGFLTPTRAAQRLPLSTQQVHRLVQRYRDAGVSGLTSLKRGQPSNHQLRPGLEQRAAALIRQHYQDFGPTLAAEKLVECHGLRLAKETVRRIMMDAGLWTPRRQRPPKLYQPRNRQACLGELIQIDGSDHRWFEDRAPACTLLVYIDDATSRLMHLAFTRSESTFSYFQATRAYLEHHGKPSALYSDKASVFRVNSKDAQGGDGHTQFARAVFELNIDTFCANSSQAKGRVERAYLTLQDRLVKTQIEGFGSYGFPESHAASFALLTYASCWLKCHEQAAFAAALINSHPMGFYSPDQVLQDARRHRIEIRPVDASCSDWDCTLEAASQDSQPAIRLGLRMVRGLSKKAGRAVEEARRRHPFRDVADLCLRAGLDSRARDCLADAGALQGLAGHRFQARWSMAAVEPQLPLFADGVVVEEEVLELGAPSVGENLYADYATLGTTLGPHPLTLLRPELMARRLMSSRDLAERRHGQPARVAGLVVGRQRPGTASGITFVTLEDEFGMVNVVVRRDLAERQRRDLVASQLLRVDGTLENREGVMHVVAGRLVDISELLQGLDVRSRDFR